ncbi:MAG: hypothetical protein GWP08_21685, partial [Nitrospiraceae bacterium]|nr:hypothetical protein [Nitrospiraceae bacterium]
MSFTVLLAIVRANEHARILTAKTRQTTPKVFTTRRSNESDANAQPIHNDLRQKTRSNRLKKNQKSRFCDTTGEVGLAWSPDGRLLAVTSNQGLQLVDKETGRVAKTLASLSMPIKTLAWSPDGKTLASGAEESIQLFDVESGDLAENYNGPAGYSLQWSDDGSRLASSSLSALGIWNTRAGTLLRTMPWRAVLSPGARIAIREPSYRLARLVGLQDDRIFRTILCLPDRRYAVITPEGHYLGSPGIE